jgi:hypothetical protein
MIENMIYLLLGLIIFMLPMVIGEYFAKKYDWE